MAEKNTDNNNQSSSDVKAKKPSTPEVNDIAKPGETAPSATSRPIITSHSGMVKQDPMVSDGAKTDDDPMEEKKPSAISKKGELKLEPDNKDIKPEEEKTEESAEKKAETVAQTDSKSQKEEPAQKPESSDKSSNKDDKGDAKEEAGESTDSDSAAIDSLAESAGKDKKSSGKTEEEKKRDEKTKSLVDSRQYNIPIVEGGHRASSERFVGWLFLILLALAIAVYLAIDAGYLDVGISLPYNFIGN